MVSIWSGANYPGPAESGPCFLDVGERAERELDLGGLVAAEKVDALAAAKGAPSPADLVPPHPGRVGAQADVPAVQQHSPGRPDLYRSGPDKQAGPAAEALAPVDPVPAWMLALANQDSTVIDHRLIVDPGVQPVVPALAHQAGAHDKQQKRDYEEAEDLPREPGHRGSPFRCEAAGVLVHGPIVHVRASFGSGYRSPGDASSRPVIHRQFHPYS
jgi:hypothetical protein